MKHYSQSLAFFVLMMTSLLNSIEAADRLETLETEHPRLVCHDARLSEIKNLIEHDDQAKAIYQSLVDQAEDTLTKPLFVIIFLMANACYNKAACVWSEFICLVCCIA